MYQRAFVSGLRRSYLDSRPVLSLDTFSQRAPTVYESIVVFQRLRPSLVAQCNEGCLLSARLRAGKSPALTGHLSTGNRRQHRVLIGWLFESRGPLHNCGGKSGLLPERKNGVQLELSGMALNGRVGWLRGYAEEDKKASQQTLCCDGAQKTKRIAPRRLRSEYGLGPEHFHVLARTLCIKGES